jgi:phosphohistidine swiveling domain-containing protein
MKIRFLSDKNLTDKELQSFGGKASSLSRLLLAKFPVPHGFVLLDYQDQLESAVASIGGFPVAVRSSCSLEDLADASFAGLYDTFLFIQNFDELYEAIKKCFASKYSERVTDYLKAKNIVIDLKDLSMSVLVQKMINAKVAGVLFTMNPLNGREEEMYLELCEGVGERLVSGHVTPTQIVYNWIDAKKMSETINAEGTKISDFHLAELIECAERIQAYYGRPQDIEWAIGPDDKLHVLQSRPITTLVPRDDVPELTNADFKDGGVSARVCTPLMFSVYREALKNSMGDYFKKINLIPNDEKIKWIHYHYGRVYWNAEAVKEGLKKLPDFREAAFDQDLGIQKDYGEKGAHVTPFSISSVINALPVLMGLNREFLDCKIMISQFRDRFEAQDEKLKLEVNHLKKFSQGDFNRWFFEVILFQKETEKSYFRTIYNNSNFQTEYKNYLKKLPAYEENDEIDLMGELHGISHLDVQGGLYKLSKIADFYGYDSDTYYKMREGFLKIHYHHGPAELDLLVERWGERRDWVDELVRNYFHVHSKTESKFEKTFEKIYAKLNIFRKSKFEKYTHDSREYLRLREEMRAFSTRAYYLLRQGLLEFGRRNSLNDYDVFMLDVLEIKKKLLNPSYELPSIYRRKIFYEGYRSFTPPNEFGGSMQIMKSSMTSGGLKGLGCSPGEIVGRARVILDIHATGKLTKEEILVTVFTDPGWTPVLARVGGVVTEVGGLLSHAAVIGREYGIPAILNLIDATKIIQDGDLIKMNGKTGVVEILEKRS